MLAGTDSLFMLWLSFFREHLSALVGIAFLVPTALVMNPQLAGLLAALAVVYVAVNLVVVRRTQAGQIAVERYHQDVFGRVGDVIGNVTVVQSYARLAAEASALQGMMRELLAAQYPVLTWWAMLTILTRGSATIVMVVIFAAGAVLAQQGRITVGEIVSFVGFANLLIGRLDQLTGFVGRFFIQAPTVDAFLELLAAKRGRCRSPGATVLPNVAGRVAFEAAHLPLPRLRLRACSISPSPPSPARPWPWSAPPAPARPRRWRCCSACATPTPAASWSTARHPRASSLTSLRHAMAGRVPGGRPVQPLDRREPARRQGRTRPRPKSRPPRARPRRIDFIMRKPGG